MELPVIGFVSLQGVILGLFLISLAAYGYFSGLNKMLSSLFIVVIAMAVAVVPQFHDWVSGNINIIFSGKSRYAAYLTVFFVMFLALRFLFRRLPRMVELDLPKQLDKIFGALAGAVQGFVACTMFLILIYGWSIPVSSLYDRSSMGISIRKIWSQTSVLPELHVSPLR